MNALTQEGGLNVNSRITDVYDCASSCFQLPTGDAIHKCWLIGNTFSEMHPSAAIEIFTKTENASKKCFPASELFKPDAENA